MLTTATEKSMVGFIVWQSHLVFNRINVKEYAGNSCVNFGPDTAALPVIGATLVGFSSELLSLNCSDLITVTSASGASCSAPAIFSVAVIGSAEVLMAFSTLSPQLSSPPPPPTTLP